MRQVNQPYTLPEWDEYRTYHPKRFKLGISEFLYLLLFRSNAIREFFKYCVFLSALILWLYAAQISAAVLVVISMLVWDLVCALFDYRAYLNRLNMLDTEIELRRQKLIEAMGEEKK